MTETVAAVEPAPDERKPDEERPDTGDAAREPLSRLRAEIAKAVVGQDSTVAGLVIALLCRGHVLLEGVPGVAKTLLIRTLGAALAILPEARRPA